MGGLMDWWIVGMGLAAGRRAAKAESRFNRQAGCLPYEALISVVACGGFSDTLIFPVIACARS
jgi:hypothetical protein